MDAVTIAGIARIGRTHRARSRARPITPVEARLLTLGPAGAPIAALPAFREATSLRPKSRHDVRSYAEVAFWLVVFAVFGIGSYVIDRGGHALPPRSAAAALSVSGTARVPVSVSEGDVLVRVTVRSSTVPWFWCLESSRGLPPDQHLCRNSAGIAAPGEFVATEGVVRLDAALVQGADFFVAMYCRDACEWRADAERLPVRAAVPPG